MTLAKIIDTLKMIALKHPNINSAYEGNIYDILNAKPDNKYASVVITQQSHTTDETYDHYGFVIFYVDRLLNDLDENRVQIQSIGKSMLGNIITAFCNEFEAECDNIIYQPFTQRFADETAGVYCTITIDTVKDAYCAERYWDENWTAPIVSIKNVDKTITITENGHYVLDYDPTVYTGIGKVDIDVDFNTEPFYNEGYEQGKTDGISEQKSKLESINITENGRYTKEDGYNEIVVDVPDLNGSYDEGYEQGKTDGEQEGYNSGYDQGQADVAANARVLDVTKNGNYLSKFSDPIVPEVVTGVYADGTEFYSYAELNGKVFNTKIPATKDSRIEFWWKNDNNYNRYAAIIGGQTYEGYIFKFAEYSRNTYRIEYGDYKVGNLFYHNFDYDMTSRWNHIVFSKQDGLYVNDELICEVQGERWGENETIPNFWINAAYSEEVTNNANGTFGMIKINDTIIIPTADGFQNVNTGELLEVVHNGDYTFTENVPIYPKGELYKTINVNILPKVNVQKAGLKLGFSTFKEVPEWADFEGITNMNHMFSNCGSLQTIPLINTHNVTDMGYMFNECSSLKTIPLLDTSNVTNFRYFLYLSKITELPQFDLRKGVDFYEFCYNCYNLKYVPNLDLSSATNISGLLENCNSLISVGELKVPNVRGDVSYFLGGSNKDNLTDFGGLIGFRGSITTDGFHTCPNLTYQSCINILNGLYDFSGNGETPSSNEGKLKVHQNFLDKVGEEISIGTLKGWTITA